jgi:hypothetical protein
MSLAEYADDDVVVGAIRLALVGAADNTAALSLVQWLVAQAAPTRGDDTQPTALFIAGIRDLGFSVSTDAPSGAYAPDEGESAAPVPEQSKSSGR